MYLNKMLLKDFGKFNNKEIELRTGINLLYGSKGEGKSTVKDFIVSMIYGPDKAQGIGNGNIDDRRPISGKGFSGKAYLQSNGNKYLVERNFQRHNRTVNVLELSSGRDVRLDNKDTLQGTMVHVDKECYMDTLCIDAPSSEASEGIERELDTYVSALTTSGTVNVNKHHILEKLRDERVKYDVRPILKKMDGISRELEKYENVEADINVTRKQMKTLDEEFAIEAAKRKREARKLIESDDGEISYEDDFKLSVELERVSQNEVLLDAIHEEIPEQKKKLTEQLWFIILTGLFVIGVITGMVNILGFSLSVKRLFVIATTLFVIATIIDGLYVNGIFTDEISTPSEEEFRKIISELQEEVATAEDKAAMDMEFADIYASKKAVLREQDKQLTLKLEEKKKLEEELEELKQMKTDCDKERKAITLAIETISRVSEDISEELLGMINGNVSDIIEKLTAGRCTDVRLEKKKHLTVCLDGEYVAVRQLDDRLAYLTYVSVRIAVARFFCKNNMPVIIDDALEFEDDKELLALAECLNTIHSEQIIVLTSDDCLGDKFASANIECNCVSLA